ncbi:MAG: hypothetical protein LBT37_05935 [Lactobacillaceae bacterium]|jgi:hypothetical protein|nr:hypothetical protein [Lactobacillaceae bacterium]
MVQNREYEIMTKDGKQVLDATSEPMIGKFDLGYVDRVVNPMILDATHINDMAQIIHNMHNAGIEALVKLVRLEDGRLV